MRKIEAILHGVVTSICLLLFLSTTLSVFNMIVLTIGERRTEIGVLSALGARKRDIRRIFACESLLIGVAGSGVGFFLGNGMVMILGLTGVPLVNPLFPGKILIHPQIQLDQAAIIAGVGVVLALVASILPAHRAGLIEPVVALRGQS